MSLCNIHHFTCVIHTRPRSECNLQCCISTKMKIYYKINQISTDQYIVPTRFELYDDNILRLVWKLRFLVPSKITTMTLTNLLTKFARYAVATDSILINIGVKQNSETVCAPSLLPTDLEKLGCEFNMIGISVLDDETLKIPDGQYENSPNVKLDGVFYTNSIGLIGKSRKKNSNRNSRIHPPQAKNPQWKPSMALNVVTIPVETFHFTKL